ncbi:MAG: ShlB/FhaC/HecB family hemolysin secretion/activation protein [Burkholderiales bacterium]|nr:ShlB/FhaC/HecB family hemolysin secretion/activation protein [Burkholderiales bacterium]
MKYVLACWVLGAALLHAVSVQAAEESGAGIVRFDISRFDVQGNSLLPSNDVQTLLAPFAGKGRDFGHVQRALEALEAAYRKRGYGMVQVSLPEQELNRGVVLLKVTETRIGKVTITGNQHFDQANIRRSLPAVREGTVPNVDEISSGLHTANENPAKKVKVQFKGGQEGEVDADLQVQDGKPWTIGLNVDNVGNSSTGRNQVGVLFQHANMFDSDHVLSLQYTTTAQKPSQVAIYGVGYHIPLYALGDSVDLYASYSDVNSGGVTAGIFNYQISGKGTLFGLRYNQNLGRSKDYESKLSYGFDVKAFQSSVLLNGIQIGNDVTVHPLSLTYTGKWTLSAGEVDYFLTGLQNVPGGSKGDSAAFNAARGGAPAGYKLLRYGANFSRGFAGGWMMRLGLNGQYAKDSLVPGEQFGVGGSASVRGYQEREVSDDVGYSTIAEMYTPNLCDGSASLAQCRVLVFYDYGHVSRNNPLSGEIPSTSISGVGVGLRLVAQKYFTLQMDVGRALRTGAATAKGENRVHFKMNFLY